MLIQFKNNINVAVIIFHNFLFNFFLHDTNENWIKFVEMKINYENSVISRVKFYGVKLDVSFRVKYNCKN